MMEYPNFLYRLATTRSTNVSVNEILWKYSFTLDKIINFEYGTNDPGRSKCLIGGVSCELTKTWDEKAQIFDKKLPIPKHDHGSIVTEVEAGSTTNNSVYEN